MNRICPSCDARLSMSQSACPNCGSVITDLPAPVCRSVVRPRQRRMPLRLQSAIQIDRTGSSLAFERGIHLACKLYLNELDAHVSEVRVSVGSHGDLDYGEAHIMHLEAGSPENALRAVESIVFEGGGDAPEHHLDGIATMARQVPWSHDGLTRKAMIALVNDRTKPAQCGMTPQQIGSQIKSRGSLFYLVCEPDDDLEALATAAGGLVMPICNDPDANELKRAAAMVSRSLTATITSGGTVPMVVN